MSRLDVLVVGAGLAGLSCALRLVSAGARVAIVDRKTDVARGVQTTGIFVRKTLEDFDLPAAHLGAPVSRVVLCSPARRRLELTSEKTEFRIGRMGALYTELLRRCIDAGLPLPAYDCVLKCSHSFNLLDARRAVAVTDRADYILRMRRLAQAVARAYLEVEEPEAVA